MIFLLPLALSIVASLMIAIGDYGLGTKATVIVLTVAAAAMQFAPAIAARVHFLIPLFIQLLICGCWYVMSQFE
jgi:hypothetical protein